MSRLLASILQEPDLLFGAQRIEKDPRLGLGRFGPYHTSTETVATPTRIRVGIVGTGQNVADTKRLLEHLSQEVKSPGANKWINPDFPGFNLDTRIACAFVTADEWNGLPITEGEIRALEVYGDANERIAACVDLYVRKIAAIKMGDVPDILICVQPEWIEEYCGKSKETRGASTPKPTTAEKQRAKNKTLATWGVVEEEARAEKGYDLHNALKGKSMKHGIPFQFLRGSTLAGMLDAIENGSEPTGLQMPAQFAWNFCTALYYKANGKPWRLAKLTPGTCYVGVSFFRNKRSVENELQFSMAQVFTYCLEGFVIRGTEVTVDSKTKQAYMSEQQAHDLLMRAIEKYTSKSGTAPTRVVVHKTSKFSPTEKAGILRAIGTMPKDLVSFERRTGMRFLRQGNDPVLRGTTVRLTPTQHLLYTSGYIPRLRSYPGARVPEPVLLTHDGDSQFDLVCQEIMGLTKLDWNTAAFATSSPITIEFAKHVGDVLSEMVNDKELQDHYKFYM
ncbi:MAG: argonaute/piwi family protein [Thermoplasmatota archaeon]